MPTRAPRLSGPLLLLVAVLGACSSSSESTQDAASSELASSNAAASNAAASNTTAGDDAVDGQGVETENTPEETEAASNSGSDTEQAEPDPSRDAETTLAMADEVGPLVTFPVTKLEFELESIFDDTLPVSVWVPEGWERSEVFEDTFDPPTDADAGFFTDLSFDLGCDGICAPKDWASALNDTDGQLDRLRADRTMIEDYGIDNGWVMVSTGFSDATEILVLKWNNDSDYYFECKMSLDEIDTITATDAVELCLAARALWLE